MLKILVLILFPLVSFASNKFVVGLDSQVRKDLEVEVALELEAANPMCTEIIWNPLRPNPSVRDFIPLPTAKKNEVVQTQKVNDDVYEFAFEYDSGFCNYKITAVRLRVSSSKIGDKWSKSYFIRPLNNNDGSDVIISLEDNNKNNVFWRTFLTTPGSPQVFVVLKE